MPKQNLCSMSWSITQALSYVMLSIIAVLWSPYVFSFPLFFRDSRFFTGLSFSLGWPYTGLGEPSAAWFRAHRCCGWGWGGEGGGGGWVMLVSEGMVSVSWLISGKACAKCAARWQVTRLPPCAPLSYSLALCGIYAVVALVALDEAIVEFHIATIFLLFMEQFCWESPNSHISGRGGGGGGGGGGWAFL